jgi:hypothetical protein
MRPPTMGLPWSFLEPPAPRGQRVRTKAQIITRNGRPWPAAVPFVRHARDSKFAGHFHCDAIASAAAAGFAQKCAAEIAAALTQ